MSTYTIKKEAKDVVILTIYEKIIGQIHRLPNTRMSDALNKQSDKFIPVSNAEVFQKKDNKLLYRTPFLSLNISHIVFVSEKPESL